MNSKHRLSVGVGAALLAAAVAGAALSTSTTFKGRNGRLLYQAQVGSNTQLFTIKPDGTGVRQITHFTDHSATDANWAPGSSRIVFTQHWDPGGSTEHFLLSTINADGSGLKPLARAGRLAVGPNWLQDGRRIIYLDVSVGAGRLMIETATGGPVRPAGISGLGGDSACSLPAGRVAFLRPKPGSDGVRAIFVAGLSGHGLKRITALGWRRRQDRLLARRQAHRLLEAGIRTGRKVVERLHDPHRRNRPRSADPRERGPDQRGRRLLVTGRNEDRLRQQQVRYVPDLDHELRRDQGNAS